MILCLIAVPAFGGVVEARGRHRHGQRQQTASHDRDHPVQSAARKPGKRKKGKKPKFIGVAPGADTPNASAPQDPAGDATSSSNATVAASGPQGVADGLATSLPRRTYIATRRGICNQEAIYDGDGDPQRCEGTFIPGLAPFASPITAQIEVLSSPENCSPVKFEITWQDSAYASHTVTSGMVWPGETTGVYDLGEGVRWIAVSGIGRRGGCNIGVLGWLGFTARVMTPSDLSLIMVQE
jgi:hypothetical protein